MEYRSFDGYGNNWNHPHWGTALTPLFRHPGLYAYTADGSTPSGQDRPNPRRISDIVCSQIGNGTVNDSGLTDYLWAWGQFVDHELDLSDEAGEELPIPVPPGSHPDLPQGGTIPFKRSRFDPSTGGHAKNPREQINILSAYYDGSNVYGENRERASVLRAHVDGKLLSSLDGKLLPKNDCHLPNDGMPPTRPAGEFFVAGDVRSNENLVLTAIHTLWMREHNRTCDELIGALSAAQPIDEDLYQVARRRTIAQLQVITYEEFLPALLGKDAIPGYTGYKDNVDATISNIFSTVAYRLGHSMVSPVIQRIPPGGTPTFTPLKLEEAFWRPELIDAEPQIVDELLNGLWQQEMQQLDTRTVDGLRNLLFHEQIPAGSNIIRDLAALNIQRGRDHGLPAYNECRIAMGLAPNRDIKDITQDEETRNRLMMAYGNNVESIDPWIGGLAEDHVEGAQVGEFFYHVIRDQFTRVRDGDRFWYEWQDGGFDADQIAELKATRLSDVIQRNTSISQINEDVFRIAAPVA